MLSKYKSLFFGKILEIKIPKIVTGAITKIKARFLINIFRLVIL